MEYTTKNRKKVVAAISINAIFTVLLVITMVYLYIRVAYQQQEIKKFQTRVENVVGKNGKIMHQVP
jgi:hypothetical protein